ncbi:MAG: ATP-dependent DNA helicase RecG [Alphaproteobacteria bacterium]|nr:ATP-dependent DNA helicase RecG [Alphaproteobacteria bacterium]
MRPEILFPMFADISTLSGIGTKTYKLMQNLLNGSKVVDLLFHLPSNIIDRSYRPLLKDAVAGRICTIKAKVVQHIQPKSKQQPYRVIVDDGTGQMTLVFFKVYADSIAKNLPLGATRLISGKLESFNGVLQMTHPDYVVPETEAERLPIIESVYPLTAGIQSKSVYKFIKQALATIPVLPEWIDAEFLHQQGWADFKTSLTDVHNPQNFNDLQPFSKARARLAYDELLANQLTLAIARERVKKQNGQSFLGDGGLYRKAVELLPFKLTPAQEKVLTEIKTDQQSPLRMQRLLQGDVGSGKTVVAFLSALNVIETGAQAALMAPTEILAKQHFETLLPLCEKLGLQAALLIGKTKTKERNLIKAGLNDGSINFVIGTHALFQDDVTYHNLGYAIVDEQHRFGVEQRLKLADKGKNADTLVMTATPIPRTLVLTAVGDMDYSKIDQLPEGRKPVDTRVFPLSKLDLIVEGLKRKLDEGTRAYWVCPLVEESEKSDLAAAEARFQDLQKIFGEKVGLVHGKMKEAEKDAVMERFKRGEISLLVATTVIEVGVNVPEATLIIVEHAERFGLAQLHQLRGRVKRGCLAGSCLLVYGYPLSEVARQRLEMMRETEDGFLIAEKDLELRGGGEILGTRQSGFCAFKIADMAYHANLLTIAHKDALLILNKDPNLSSSRGQALRILLYLFEQDSGIKIYRG